MEEKKEELAGLEALDVGTSFFQKHFRGLEEQGFMRLTRCVQARPLSGL